MLSWAIKNNIFITLAKRTAFTKIKVFKRGTVYFTLGSSHEKVFYEVFTWNILQIVWDHVNVYI